MVYSVLYGYTAELYSAVEFVFLAPGGAIVLL